MRFDKKLLGLVIEKQSDNIIALSPKHYTTYTRSTVTHKVKGLNLVPLGLRLLSTMVLMVEVREDAGEISILLNTVSSHTLCISFRDEYHAQKSTTHILSQPKAAH